ncbi:MAG: hypothetical protein LBQ74_20015 [Prevotella sp.]|jgi:hypothetical protein|nr:hypothetical protein [Prevotella sp.]
MEVNIMEREIKINMLAAAMAVIIANGRKGEYENAPTLHFLSPTEVQYCEAPGEMLPTNKVFDENPLFDMLHQVVDYNIYNEQRHYLECLYEEDEVAAEAFETQNIYKPDTVPGHIYHVLRLFQGLTDDSQ